MRMGARKAKFSTMTKIVLVWNNKSYPSAVSDLLRNTLEERKTEERMMNKKITKHMD